MSAAPSDGRGAGALKGATVLKCDGEGYWVWRQQFMDAVTGKDWDVASALYGDRASRKHHLTALAYLRMQVVPTIAAELVRFDSERLGADAALAWLDIRFGTVAEAKLDQLIGKVMAPVQREFDSNFSVALLYDELRGYQAEVLRVNSDSGLADEALFRKSILTALPHEFDHFKAALRATGVTFSDSAELLERLKNTEHDIRAAMAKDAAVKAANKSDYTIMLAAKGPDYGNESRPESGTYQYSRPVGGNQYGRPVGGNGGSRAAGGAGQDEWRAVGGDRAENGTGPGPQYAYYGRGRGRGRGRSGNIPYEGGRWGGGGRGRGQGARPPPRCWACDEPGHRAAECPHKMKFKAESAKKAAEGRAFGAIEMPSI